MGFSASSASARAFLQTAEQGFSGGLTGQAPLDEVIPETEIPGLSLLLCGPLPPHPAEIINSQGFRKALEELSQRYDQSITDSPPVMPVADGRILGALCDIILRCWSYARRHPLAGSAWARATNCSAKSGGAE